MRASWAAALLIVTLSACSEAPTDPSQRLRPQNTVTTTEHFSFGPPLTALTINGTFNGALAPVVEVCASTTTQPCAQLLARFNTLPEGSSVNDGVVVEPLSEQYHVNWKLENLTAGGSYRISVRSGASDVAGTREFGAFELTATDGGSGQTTDPVTGETRNWNSTLPIKFRLEHGLLCGTRESDVASEPCLEVAVTPAGGTFVTETQLAGAYFPPNAVSSTVNLIIERYEPGPGGTYDMQCLPVTQPQYTGCYVYHTEPDLPSFNTEVTVGICPDPVAASIEDQLELWKWDEVDPNSVLELPRRNVTFLNCPGTPYYVADALTNLPGQFAWASKVLKLLAPRPLLARGISPYGGGLNDFSRIGWVRPLALQKISGDAQNGYFGQTLPDDPTIRVVAIGEKVFGLDQGVSGVPITFAPDAGSGTTSPASPILTDANGYASAAWTLGASGPQSMTVTGQNPLSGFPNLSGTWSVPGAVFTANGYELPPPPTSTGRYRVAFLSPIDSRVSSRDVNVPGVTATVRVCSTTTSQCWMARRVVDNNNYHFQWRSDATYPTGNYTFTVLEGTTVLGSFVGAVAKDGSKLPRGVDFGFQLGSTIQIKFLLIAR